MKITFDYTTLHLSPTQYKRILDTKLKEALIEGGKTWLNAAVAVIPVWSGASHGTFLKLAAKLGMTFAIGGGVPWLPGPSYGMAQSNARMTIWGGSYTLEYSTSLWHLLYNEYKDGNLDKEEARVYSRLIHPGPYHFQEHAGNAFIDFAQAIRLPNPWILMIVKRKRVG